MAFSTEGVIPRRIGIVLWAKYILCDSLGRQPIPPHLSSAEDYTGF
jgi:hypothetical protein